ncbi:MAG: DEAD/DEAH box helicase [Thermotogaceae bacterium]|nr:DEAD/DEAH box helicase [Thermotogaceae bacterium]
MKGKSIQELLDELELNPVLKGVFAYKNLHKHQEEAVKSIIEGYHTIVSTGTGSGKTESFLLPIIDRAKKQKDKKLLALLIYPMNALVNDQLRRMRVMLAGTGVTFARYTGDTPENLPGNIQRLDRMSRFSEHEIEEVKKGRLASYEESLCREEIRKNKPQILLTNYAQLEYMLLRNKDLDIFRDSDLQFIVLDEIHSYVGELGSEVACLLRRLKLVVPDSKKITFIGTSATIASKDESPETVIKRFGSRLFGVDSERIKLITESYINIISPPNKYLPDFPKDPESILETLVEEVSKISENDGLPGEFFYQMLSALTGKELIPDNAYEVLKNNIIVNELQELFSKPLSLEKAVKKLKELPGREDVDNEKIVAELYSYLLAGLIVKEDDEPLLRPKIHFFVKGIQNLKIKFVNGSREIVLNDKDEKFDRYLFDLYGCAKCGQHYFVIPSSTMHVHGTERYYIPSGILGKEPGKKQMLLLTDNIATDEAASTGETVWVCEQCGTVHTFPAEKCMNDKCGAENFVKLIKVRQTDPFNCISCGASLGSEDFDENTSSNLMRSVSNEAVDIMILAQNMLNSVSTDAAKLLIFTDNRQEAAFQAGFINERSKRFKFRNYLYSALKDDQLFTIERAADEIIRKIRENGEIKAFEVEEGKEFDYFRDSVEWFMIEEFCHRQFRRSSLETLGLVKVEYGGIRSTDDFMGKWAEKLNIEPAEIKGIVENFLDHMRRNTGISHKLLGLTKKDPRIFRGYIKFSKWFAPEKYILRAQAYSKDKLVKHWISLSGSTYYQRYLKKTFPEKDVILDRFLEELWNYLVDKEILVERENGKRAINAEALFFKRNKKAEDGLPHIFECKRCGTRTQRITPKMICPRHNCKGELVEKAIDTKDYNVKRYLSERKIINIKAYEHSGQVHRSEREKIEKDFKDEGSKVNCLVATPTLELGVDIGKLDMVLMRNVPPTPANYDQRAGRAGRRHRIAVVTTYCGRGSHDLYFFNKPEEMISGAIKVPSFSMVNIPLIAKHINSAITTKMHSLVSSDDDKLLLEAYLPEYINGYFKNVDLLSDDAHSVLKNLEGFSSPLKKLIARFRTKFCNEIDRFLENWPKDDLKNLEQSVEGSLADYFLSISPRELEKILKHIRDDLIFLIKERKEAFNTGEKTRELSAITTYLRNFTSANPSSDDSIDFYTLSILVKYGFFPGYSLTRGHVTATCLESEGFVEIDRNYNIALREFAPLSRLYAMGKKYRINKYKFYTADTKSNFKQKFVVQQTYIALKNDDKPTFDDPSSVNITSLHITDPKITFDGRPGDSENHRVIKSYDIRGFVKGKHLGGKSVNIEGLYMKFFRKDTVLLINIGSKKEITKNNNYGFLICPECGIVEQTTKSGIEHFINHMKLFHRKNLSPEKISEFMVALHAEFVSDILEVGPFPSYAKAVNFMEAMKLGASLELDINANDIDSFVNGKDNDFRVVFYETVPGGSGYIEVLFHYRNRVIETAKNVLQECGCGKACYHCLLTFWNQPFHDVLDRKLAAEVLGKIVSIQGTEIDIPQTRYEKVESDEDKSESPAEDKFLKIIEKYGLPKPAQQYPILLSNGSKTIADFAYSDAKLLIYIDGYQYHSEKGEKKIELDKRQRLYLEAEEYKVIRISAKDLDDTELMELYLKQIGDKLKENS